MYVRSMTRSYQFLTAVFITVFIMESLVVGAQNTEETIEKTKVKLVSPDFDPLTMEFRVINKTIMENDTDIDGSREFSLIPGRYELKIRKRTGEKADGPYADGYVEIPAGKCDLDGSIHFESQTYNLKCTEQTEKSKTLDVNFQVKELKGKDTVDMEEFTITLINKATSAVKSVNQTTPMPVKMSPGVYVIKVQPREMNGKYLNQTISVTQDCTFTTVFGGAQPELRSICGSTSIPDHQDGKDVFDTHRVDIEMNWRPGLQQNYELDLRVVGIPRDWDGYREDLCLSAPHDAETYADLKQCSVAVSTASSDWGYWNNSGACPARGCTCEPDILNTMCYGNGVILGYGTNTGKENIRLNFEDNIKDAKSMVYAVMANSKAFTRGKMIASKIADGYQFATARPTVDVKVNGEKILTNTQLLDEINWQTIYTDRNFSFWMPYCIYRTVYGKMKIIKYENKVTRGPLKKSIYDTDEKIKNDLKDILKNCLSEN